MPLPGGVAGGHKGAEVLGQNVDCLALRVGLLPILIQHLVQVLAYLALKTFLYGSELGTHVKGLCYLLLMILVLSAHKV